MSKFVTFGEVMLRLKSPHHEKLFQSPALEATFGGGEANVAVSLANYGLDAKFVTALPENDIADACIREIRGFGVDTGAIVRRITSYNVCYTKLLRFIQHNTHFNAFCRDFLQSEDYINQQPALCFRKRFFDYNKQVYIAF